MEFVDVPRCYKCQGYGHMEARCMREKVICGYCSKDGHRVADCGNKGVSPRCANCGLGFTTGHMGCRVRLQVEKVVMVGTDYGLRNERTQHS